METLTELCQQNKLTGIYAHSQPRNLSKKQLKMLYAFISEKKEGSF